MKFSAIIVFIAAGLTFLAPVPAFANFDSWRQGFRNEAIRAGVSPKTFDAALLGVEPMPEVIELDQKQPENTRSFADYLASTASSQRISRGRSYLSQYSGLLGKISHEYGVEPQYIVALWAMESQFGDRTGNYAVVDSLATLAYEGRRRELFSGELVQALLILQEEGLSSDELQGSWAGAMGQCQFMPSSFRRFAVDYNRDGTRDIWETQADVFASIANYLSESGWQAGEGWGVHVSLPPQFSSSLVNTKQRKTVEEWGKLGVTLSNGSPLPHSAKQAVLSQVDDDPDYTYLTYANYNVLHKWNRSNYFVTSVGTLADAMAR